MLDTIDDEKEEKLRLIELILESDVSLRNEEPSPEWYGAKFDELYDMSLTKLKVFATIKKLKT